MFYVLYFNGVQNPLQFTEKYFQRTVFLGYYDAGDKYHV